MCYKITGFNHLVGYTYAVSLEVENVPEITFMRIIKGQTFELLHIAQDEDVLDKFDLETQKKLLSEAKDKFVKFLVKDIQEKTFGYSRFKFQGKDDASLILAEKIAKAYACSVVIDGIAVESDGSALVGHGMSYFLEKDAELKEEN